MSTSHVDLEIGCLIPMTYQNSVSDVDDDEDSRSIRFSDADVGSCYSTFYSTADGSYEDLRFTDHELGDLSESTRDSSFSDCSVYLEIHGEVDGEVKMHLDDEEEEVEDELRECRICQLSLGIGSDVIALGCDCKNDLAIAHSNCAKRWFKIRGNRICEICNSIAENVSELEVIRHSTATYVSTTVTAPLGPPSPVETDRSVWLRPCLLNVLLCCMVFAFAIYFLFHIPS